MPLIKSISGIRGTIGGKPGQTLSPIDVVKYAAAYGSWLLLSGASPKVVIGRDARISGSSITQLVSSTLQSLGIHVVDLGLSTTPTVEMAVPGLQAGGGIIITASHNPGNWNALKLLNSEGEFISAEAGEKVLTLAEEGAFEFVQSGKMGSYTTDDTWLAKHIDAIMALPLVDKEAIAAKNFRVVLDCVNSTGGIVVPMLLEALGVRAITPLFCEPNGQFPHNPEPLPENLGTIANELQRGSFDIGIVVDPDVDRLVFVNEDGSFFGEEYTLVAVADYVLKHKKGNTVSNLSSTQALRDVTIKHGGEYHASAVGEVNVVEKMREVGAVIGGEGNGGVIYPDLHYGRDALVGIALFLSHLAHYGRSMSSLRSSYPSYHISKNKIELTPQIDVDNVLVTIAERYKKQPTNTIDGLRIDFDGSWVHLRKSNTEPIIRIYSEANSQVTAENLANKIIADIKELVSQSA